MGRLFHTGRKYWVNAQYSRRDTIEVAGKPSSIGDQDLENIVHNMFGEIGVNINEHTGLSSTQDERQDDCEIVNRKDCTIIFRVKKDLKHLDPSN